MVVVNETKRGQLLALLEQCAHLNADVRPRTDKGYFTVTVPPPWNGPAQRKAQEVQDRIKKWSEQYPNVICYSDCILDPKIPLQFFHFEKRTPAAGATATKPADFR